jgi:hypothetical protein
MCNFFCRQCFSRECTRGFSTSEGVGTFTQSFILDIDLAVSSPVISVPDMTVIILLGFLHVRIDVSCRSDGADQILICSAAPTDYEVR